MATVLDIDSGETRTIDSGLELTHTNLELDGTLQLDGILHLTGDRPQLVNVADDDLISLPLQIDVRNMDLGIAMFLTMVMGLLLGAVALLKNYAAGVMWSFAFAILIYAGIFQLGLEIFWMAVVATIILLAAGMIVRWANL